MQHQNSHRSQSQPGDPSFKNLFPSDCIKSLALDARDTFIGTTGTSQVSVQVFSTRNQSLSLLRVRVTPDIPKNDRGFEKVVAYPHSVDLAHRKIAAIFSRFPGEANQNLPLVCTSELRELLEDARTHNQNSMAEEVIVASGTQASTSITTSPLPPLRFPKQVRSLFDELLNDTLRYAICIEWHKKILAEIEITRSLGSRPQANVMLHLQDGADIIKPLPGSPFRDLDTLNQGVAKLTETIFLSVQDELDRTHEHTGAARILDALGKSLGLTPHVSTLLSAPLFAESTFGQLRSEVNPATTPTDTSAFTLLTYAQRIAEGGVFRRPVMNVMVIGRDHETQLFRLQLTVPNLRSIAGCEDATYLRTQAITWLSQPETTAQFIVNSSPSAYQMAIVRAMRAVSSNSSADKVLSFGVLPNLSVDESDPYVTPSATSLLDRELRISVAEVLLDQGTPITASRFDAVVASQATAIHHANLASTWRVQAVIGDNSSFLQFQNPLGATITLRGEGLDYRTQTDTTEERPAASNQIAREYQEAQEIEKRRYDRAHTLLSLASRLDAPPELLLQEAQKQANASLMIDSFPSAHSAPAYHHAGRVASLWLHLLQSEGFLSPSEARNILRQDPGRLFTVELLDDGRCLLKLVTDAGISSRSATTADSHHTICLAPDGVQSIWLTAPSQHPVSGELSSVVRNLTRRGVQFTKRDGCAFSEEEVRVVLLVLAEPHSTEKIIQHIRNEAPAITVSEQSIVTRTIRERLSRWLRRR